MTRFPGLSQQRAITPDEVRKVAARLRARVMTQRVLIAVMIVFGLPLMFVGPLAAAGMVWAAEARYFGGLSPFGTLFLWACVIGMPLLLVLESQTAGKLGENMAVEYSDNVGADRLMGHQGGQMVVLIIFSMLGPGMVMGAYRRIKGQVAHRAAPLDRCAEVTAQLARVEGGVDVTSLQKPGERFEDLLTVLEYLVHYDWVGAGRGGQRVWLLSDAKKRLQ